MFYISGQFWKLMIDALNNGGWPAMYIIIIGTPITLSIDFIIDIIQFTYQAEAVEKDLTWKRGQHSYLYNAFAETFAPLSRIGKNIHDTFKPYKYSAATEFQRIVRQPAEGIANLFSGLYRIITAPLYGIVMTTLLILSLIGKPSHFKNIFKKLSVVIPSTISRTLNGASRIVAGLAQIALTPFTWFVKPLIRLGITLISPIQKIEDNTGLQNRLDSVNTDSTTEQKLLTYASIHNKFKKSLALGQLTAIDQSGEEDLFNKLYGELNQHFVAAPSTVNASTMPTETQYTNLMKHTTIFTVVNHSLVVPAPVTAPSAPAQRGEGEPENTFDDEYQPGSPGFQ
jgi:hypothetical protein